MYNVSLSTAPGKSTYIQDHMIPTFTSMMWYVWLDTHLVYIIEVDLFVAMSVRRNHTIFTAVDKEPFLLQWIKNFLIPIGKTRAWSDQKTEQKLLLIDKQWQLFAYLVFNFVSSCFRLADRKLRNWMGIKWRFETVAGTQLSPRLWAHPGTAGWLNGPVPVTKRLTMWISRVCSDR